MVARKVFLAKPKHQHNVSSKDNMIILPNHEKYGDYYENSCLSHLMDELWFQENGEKKSFSCIPMHLYLESKKEEHDFSA